MVIFHGGNCQPHLNNWLSSVIWDSTSSFNHITSETLCHSITPNLSPGVIQLHIWDLASFKMKIQIWLQAWTVSTNVSLILVRHFFQTASAGDAAANQIWSSSENSICHWLMPSSKGCRSTCGTVVRSLFPSRSPPQMSLPWQSSSWQQQSTVNPEISWSRELLRCLRLNLELRLLLGLHSSPHISLKPSALAWAF